MKTLKNIGLSLLALILLAVSGLALVSYLGHSADRDYHSELIKGIKLTSATFAEDGPMPIRCTCKGGDTSPALAWSEVPTGAKSLVLTVNDFDAPAEYLRLFNLNHFVAADLPPTAASLPEGFSMTDLAALGATIGQNTFGDAKYVGPCPPLGNHTYNYRLYALDIPKLKVEGTPSQKNIMLSMRTHILAYAELKGTFGN